MQRLLPLNWMQHLDAGPDARPAAMTPTAEVRDIWRARDGSAITLRAARPDDGPIMQALVRGLSMKSRYQRFFYPAHELTPDLLARFTHNDPEQAMTLLAVAREKQQEVAIAMAQYVIGARPGRCELAVVVTDAWQRQGLGRKLMQSLICLARAAGVERVEADLLADNAPMRRLMLAMGFTLARHEDGAYLMKASKVLSAPEWTCSPLTALAAQCRRIAMPLAPM